MLHSNQFFVDKLCFNAIREFGAYRYQKNKPNESATEKPIKDQDHMMDSIRYCLFSFKLFKRKCTWDFVPNLIGD